MCSTCTTARFPLFHSWAVQNVKSNHFLMHKKSWQNSGARGHPKANINKQLLFLDGIITLVSDACWWRPLGEQKEEMSFLWGFEEQSVFLWGTKDLYLQTQSGTNRISITCAESPPAQTLLLPTFYNDPFIPTTKTRQSRHNGNACSKTKATHLTEFCQPFTGATFSWCHSY